MELKMIYAERSKEYDLSYQTLVILLELFLNYPYTWLLWKFTRRYMGHANTGKDINCELRPP